MVIDMKGNFGMIWFMEMEFIMMKKINKPFKDFGMKISL